MPQFPIVRNHAPWQKTLIIPLWILQLIFLITVFALALASLVQNGNYRNFIFGNIISYAETNRGATTVLGIDTGVSVAAIVLTFAEAFCLANRNLLPPLFLLSNIIKLMLFVVLAGLDGAGINRGYDQHRVGGVAAFAIDIIVIIMTVLALIYAAIILAKTRRVDLSSNYGAVNQDLTKDNPTYSTNPVDMTDTVPNTIIEPDIAYTGNGGSSLAGNSLGRYASQRQTSGIASPAPRMQHYYGTDTISSTASEFHELPLGNEVRIFSEGREDPV